MPASAEWPSACAGSWTHVSTTASGARATGGMGHLAKHAADPGAFSGSTGMSWPSQGGPLAAAKAMSAPHSASAATEAAAKPASNSASTDKTVTKRWMDRTRMFGSVATNRARIKGRATRPLRRGLFGAALLEAAAGWPWPAWVGRKSVLPAPARCATDDVRATGASPRPRRCPPGSLGGKASGREPMAASLGPASTSVIPG